MNTNTVTLKPTHTLVHGDLFTYRGERGCFLHFTGYPYSTRYGTYQMAFVDTPDGVRKWSLAMAGSVKIH